MIAKFRHKGLKRFFEDGDHSGLDPQMTAKIRRLLFALDVARSPSEMNVPGFRFHALKGDRLGQYAVTVSGNWRIVFEFDGVNATSIDLLDYH